MITERQRELLQDIADGKRFNVKDIPELNELVSAGLIAPGFVGGRDVTELGRKAMEEFDAARVPEPVEPEHPNPDHPLALTDAQARTLELVLSGNAKMAQFHNLNWLRSKGFVTYPDDVRGHVVTTMGNSALIRYNRIAQMKKERPNHSPIKNRFIAVVVAALAELNPDDDADEMLDHVAKRVNDARWSLQ
jgi:hypothetical protein